MRIGVIGLAGVGKVHVQKFSSMDEATLACVCDIASEIAKETGEKYGVNYYTNAEEMLDKENLTGVSLCTPPKVHHPQTKMAAERGVNVLCEKPMASTVQDCQKMIDVCNKRGVTLMIAHKKRFVPTIAKLKELTEGEFGPIRYLLHRYPHPGMSDKDWFWAEDDGGGPILENAVHAADTIGFLMGDVERVYAEGGTFFAPHRKPQIDCAVYTLRFKNGSIATVGAGMVSMGSFSFEDFYAANENGVAEISGPFDNAATLKYAFRKDPGDVKVESYPDSDPFLAEMKHFLECIGTGSEPIASGEAGKKAIAICRAVKKSAETAQPEAVCW